jgi:hypothetical protein
MSPRPLGERIGGPANQSFTQFLHPSPDRLRKAQLPGELGRHNDIEGSALS